MRAGKAFAVVGGALAALVAIALVLAGSALALVHATQRDDDGFYTAGPEHLTSSAYAVTAEHVDLVADARDGDWVPGVDFGTARIDATAAGGRAVFVGIARQDDIDAYLAASAHDEVVDVSLLPTAPAYRHGTGTTAPAPPRSQGFWVASVAGAGEQTLRWEIERGEWGVVFMNADASPGVEVHAQVGVRTGLLLPIGLGLLVGGVLAGAVAAGLFYVGFRREGPTAEATTPPVPVPSTAATTVAAGAYPVRLDGRLDEGLSRWLWLVKWFLAIPHFVVLAFLWLAFCVLTFVAGVAVVFTGRYPEGVFRFNVGVLRWTWRVTFYAFALGTDRYPPFSLEPDPTYPAAFDVDYPTQLSRGLVLVKWWLLAIPHYLVLAVFGGGVGWFGWTGAGDNGGFVGAGLVGVIVLIAAVGLLFSGRYPQALFDFVMGMQRWTYRVYAYVALMRDEYPPFRLDSGGADPGVDGGPPVEPAPPAPQHSDELVGAR